MGGYKKKNCLNLLTFSSDFVETRLRGYTTERPGRVSFYPATWFVDLSPGAMTSAS